MNQMTTISQHRKITASFSVTIRINILALKKKVTTRFPWYNYDTDSTSLVERGVKWVIILVQSPQLLY